MVVALAALLVLNPACGSSSGTPDAPDDLHDELERRIDAAAMAGFSGSGLVTVDGVTALARGYGLASATSSPRGRADRRAGRASWDFAHRCFRAARC
ncbi:hypothetical protein [Sorangium cellulosum]|uniref:hypothetical protein n=1 Tax=Sorangium cellulosum TaxID=56 RepID=UPI000B2B8FEF|nr:hypothetical protein [Sorangium cellulosum]